MGRLSTYIFKLNNTIWKPCNLLQGYKLEYLRTDLHPLDNFFITSPVLSSNNHHCDFYFLYSCAHCVIISYIKYILWYYLGLTSLKSNQAIILKEMGILDHLTWLWEICMQVKKQQIGLGMEQLLVSKLGKGVHQGYILSTCLFNLYSEYIMWNAEPDEAQAEIKITVRNITNLRCADDSTLMAVSEEEVKSRLMKVKEESKKACLKLNIQKTKTTNKKHPVPSLHGK